MVLDFAPSLLATRPVAIWAPFTSVKTLGGEKESESLSDRFGSMASVLWDKLVAFRDFLAFMILLVRLGLEVTRASSLLTPRCVRHRT